MALKHIEGFDYVDSLADLLLLYDGHAVGTGVIQSTTGAARFGRGLQFQVGGGIGVGGHAYLQKNIGGTEDTMITGFAFYSATNLDGTHTLMSFYEGGTCHIDLRENNSNPRTLTLTRDGTTLDTETSAYSEDTWNYIEMKATIHDTTGSFEVRVNGVTIMTGTNVDTKNGGTGYIDTMLIGPRTGSSDEDYDYRYDDWYVCDDTGSLNNDFLGDMRVEALYPNGAGNSTQWTPSAGSNYQNVDETPSDEDSTYNASSSASQIDLFTMTNMSSATNLVHGIREIVEFRKDDAGSRTLRQVVRTGSTDYEGSDLTASDSYIYRTAVRETSPNTSAAWTETNVNGLEAGYKLQA